MYVSLMSSVLSTCRAWLAISSFQDRCRVCWLARCLPSKRFIFIFYFFFPHFDGLAFCYLEIPSGGRLAPRSSSSGGKAPFISHGGEGEHTHDIKHKLCFCHFGRSLFLFFFLKNHGVDLTVAKPYRMHIPVEHRTRVN